MIPFGNFAFFGIMLYAVVPTVLLGIAGRAGRRWTLIVTLLYLIAQYSSQFQVTAWFSLPNVLVVAGYALFEWFVAISFLGARLQYKSNTRFCSAFLLAIAPLASVKFLPLTFPSAEFGFLGISYITFRILDILFCVQDGLIKSLPGTSFSLTCSSSPPLRRVQSIAIGASTATGNPDVHAKIF